MKLVIVLSLVCVFVPLSLSKGGGGGGSSSGSSSGGSSTGGGHSSGSSSGGSSSGGSHSSSSGSGGSSSDGSTNGGSQSCGSRSGGSHPSSRSSGSISGSSGTKSNIGRGPVGPIIGSKPSGTGIMQTVLGGPSHPLGGITVQKFTDTAGKLKTIVWAPSRSVPSSPASGSKGNMLQKAAAIFGGAFVLETNWVIWSVEKAIKLIHQATEGIIIMERDIITIHLP